MTQESIIWAQDDSFVKLSHRGYVNGTVELSPPFGLCSDSSEKREEKEAGKNWGKATGVKKRLSCHVYPVKIESFPPAACLLRAAL